MINILFTGVCVCSIDLDSLLNALFLASGRDPLERQLHKQPEMIYVHAYVNVVMLVHIT